MALNSLGAMETRQSEILECVCNLTDLLAANTNPKEIELQCSRIRQYACDTICSIVSLSQYLRHIRREKRKRQKKNKKEYIKELQNLNLTVGQLKGFQLTK